MDELFVAVEIGAAAGAQAPSAATTAMNDVERVMAPNLSAATDRHLYELIRSA